MHPKLRRTTHVCSWLAAIACVGSAQSCGERSPDAASSGNAATSSMASVGPGPLEVLATSEALATVVDLHVTHEGRVWAMNSTAPYFVGFDAEGSEVEVWGAQGGGPEEFQAPAGFVGAARDGDAWAFDARRHGFVRIAGADSVWSEVALPRDRIPPGTVQGGMSLVSSIIRTARWGDHLVVPHSTGSLRSGLFDMVERILKAELLAFDPASGQTTLLLDLGAVLDDPFEEFEATEGGIPLWRRLWAVCGDHLRVYDRVRHQLRGFDASGAEVTPIDVPGQHSTTVTPEQFARAVFPLSQAEATGRVGGTLEPADSARLVAQMAQGLSGTPAQLAAYIPTYVDFRCSPSGEVWLQPVDLEAGGLEGRSDWLHLPTDGAPQTVELPPRFRAFRFFDDRVWGVVLDDFDVASVASIRLR